MERVQHSCKSTESRPSLKSEETKRPMIYKFQTGEKTAVRTLHQWHVIWHLPYNVPEGTWDIWNQLEVVSMVWWDHNWAF